MFALYTSCYLRMIPSTKSKNILRLIFDFRNLLPIILILLIFLLDRYSKSHILTNFDEKSFYINDFLNINLLWNTGVGFGLFSTNSNTFYNFISLLIFSIIVILIYMVLTSDKNDKIIFSIIIGGALGNFYDRIYYKAVPDFIDLHYNNFHWFTFNVADIFITIGIIFFLMKETLIKRKK